LPYHPPFKGYGPQQPTTKLSGTLQKAPQPRIRNDNRRRRSAKAQRRLPANCSCAENSVEGSGLIHET